MNPQRMQRIVRAELGKLRREGITDSETHAALLAQYPVERWDYSALGRWFLVFGAIAFAAGIYILGAEIFLFTLTKLAIGLGVLIAGCFFLGRHLRTRNLAWSGRVVESVGGLAIVGLTFTLGAIYSTGSGNWPALLLIDLMILLPLAYRLRNVLLLMLNLVVFFTWFGGVTGYASGWGMYWFGMNYPLRFLIAGLLMGAMSLLHRRTEQNRLCRYDGFFKVWLSSGIFFSEMSLWLMSLFGNFGSLFERHLETTGELLLFNALWAGFNLALLKLGSRYGLRMLRGYAITFLIIHGYTLYFWHIAGHLGWIFASFLAGGVTLALVIYLESRRAAAKAAG